MDKITKASEFKIGMMYRFDDLRIDQLKGVDFVIADVRVHRILEYSIDISLPTAANPLCRDIIKRVRKDQRSARLFNTPEEAIEYEIYRKKDSLEWAVGAVKCCEYNLLEVQKFRAKWYETRKKGGVI
tara:strand:+ start:621 stop:1004 length:384 start_codon:yes stop_codon:yes gene_type:complete